jgi:hypothetical protein
MQLSALRKDGRRSTMRSTPAFGKVALVALVPALVAAGCTGAVSTGGGAPGGGNGSGSGGVAPGGTGGTVTTPGSGGAPVVPTTDACPSTDITPMPVRRLTRFEYANTIKTLLAGVSTTPVADLPADEVTDGFNNIAAALTVSPLHAEKYVFVSESLAKTAVTTVPALTACAAGRAEETCALDFARSFGRRTFRRPITTEDEQILMAAYTAGRTGGTYAEGIEVMIRAALQSTHFLFRLETTAPANATAKLVPLSQYEMASRLSFTLWGSGPDDALLDAAGRGELGTKESVAARARTMLADTRARAAVTEFYNQWMGTSRLDITSKSPSLFPAYTPAVRDAMKAELPAFVEHVLWTGDHKLSTLLTSQQGFVTSALAPIYGVTAPQGSSTAPQMVTLPAAQNRSGILSQAGFMAAQAHPDQTSPVLRGKFVRTRMMCQVLMMAPPEVDITPPTIDEGATARERFSAHLTAGSTCNGCHAMMDPIGLAFENFDAIGQYRTTEGGKTIDVSGAIMGAPEVGLNGAFSGVKELGMKLAASDQVQDCVATHWFRYATGRFEETPDSCSLGTLQEKFAASGADLAELVVAMTQTDAFWYRAPLTP